MKLLKQRTIKGYLRQRISTMRTQGDSQCGQGLVEFAMVLVLVSVVTILALQLVGDGVQESFCAASSAVGADVSAINGCDYINVTKTRYNKKHQFVRIWATYYGDAKDVELVVSPGGPMELKNPKKKKFYIKINNQQCPCTLTVRSTNGYSETVEIK